jgi:hypothetical protein
MAGSATWYVKSIHVGGPRCVTSSTDHIPNIQAWITWTVEVIRGCIFFYVDVEIQGRVWSRLIFFSILIDCQVLPLHAQAKQSKIKAGTHVVLPMKEEEHALPMSTVHHVDGTQPMVDLLQSVRLRLNGGYVGYMLVVLVVKHFRCETFVVKLSL